MRFWRGHNRVAPGVPAAPWRLPIVAITTALFMTAVINFNYCARHDEDTSS